MNNESRVLCKYMGFYNLNYVMFILNVIHIYNHQLLIIFHFQLKLIS